MSILSLLFVESKSILEQDIQEDLDDTSIDDLDEEEGDGTPAAKAPRHAQRTSARGGTRCRSMTRPDSGKGWIL